MITTHKSNNAQQVIVTGLRITPDARDPRWEVPPVKGGTPVTLIGWVRNVDLADAGVPLLAREIIARALTRFLRITFPHPDPRQDEGEWTCVSEPPRLGGPKGSAAIPLFSTTRPASAVRLFDAHPFSWRMKSQVAVLSDAVAPPLDLSYPTVERLLAHETIDEALLVKEAEVRGVLIPAADGDLAALILLDARLANDVRASLEYECKRAGITWEVLTESEFRGR